MTISDLNQIEARVNVGEMDVVGIAPGQKARLEVDAFKDRKFTGVVTAVANSALGSGKQFARRRRRQRQRPVAAGHAISSAHPRQRQGTGLPSRHVGDARKSKPNIAPTS